MSSLIDQPSKLPTLKVTATAVTGLATAVLVGAARHYGLELPEPVAQAIVLVAAWAAGYIKRDRVAGAVLARAEATAEQLLASTIPAGIAAGMVSELAPGAGGRVPVTPPVVGVRRGAHEAPPARRGPQD